MENWIHVSELHLLTFYLNKKVCTINMDVYQKEAKLTITPPHIPCDVTAVSAPTMMATT